MPSSLDALSRRDVVRRRVSVPLRGEARGVGAEVPKEGARASRLCQSRYNTVQ